MKRRSDSRWLFSTHDRTTLWEKRIETRRDEGLRRGKEERKIEEHKCIITQNHRHPHLESFYRSLRMPAGGKRRKFHFSCPNKITFVNSILIRLISFSFPQSDSFSNSHHNQSPILPTPYVNFIPFSYPISIFTSFRSANDSRHNA